ncbi:MAG: S8 family serine peptidase [Armatimonadota bacterium]
MVPYLFPLKGFSQLAVLLSAVLFSCVVCPRVLGAPPEKAQGELLVKMVQGPASAAAANAHKAVGAKVQKDFPRLGWQKVKLPPGMTVEVGIVRYKKIRGVAHVQPNYAYHTSGTPDDPMFDRLWGMTKINAPAAWDISTGSAEIVVADIDTGVDYTHPELAANMWINPGEVAGNGADDDGNGYVDDIYGVDTVNYDSDPMDDNGHGTHTSGTIGAVGNNAEGVAGVNWSVRIMALKFLDAGGSGWTDGAIACFEYALMMKERGVNIRVTNNSWGGGWFDQALKDAIDACGNAGILNICAAGNYAVDNDQYLFYPASMDCESIISVAASDLDDNPAWFTNWGATTVDLAAPGVGILSTLPGNSYSGWSGTSMATPHVTGAVALLCAIDGEQTAAELKNRIMQSVDPVSWPSRPTVTNGRLNLARAIDNTFIQVSAFRVVIPEGDTATFGVRLSRDPEGTVTISVSKDSGDPDITVTDGATLVFDSANWSAFQHVTLAAAPDDDNIDGTAAIICSAPEWQNGYVTAVEYDSERPDYFTEQFTGNAGDAFDLDYRMLTFVPNGSSDYYQAFCTPIAGLPTNPDGGTFLELGDDSYAEVNAAVSLYGQTYSSFFVGSNGYLTFTSGDFSLDETLDNHFALPRISALFDDLYPSSSQVSYKVLPDRVVVTFMNVQEFYNGNSNTFQIEMLDSGVINIAYLNVDAQDGLAGLSYGQGLPLNFAESDLSAYPALAFNDYEADAAPSPDGDGTVTGEDLTQIGRYATGLESMPAGREFLRADCQPLATLGDGVIDAADLVQAGRYAAGLDPLTEAGGPASPASAAAAGSSGDQGALARAPQREMALSRTTLRRGQTGTVTLTFKALGNECALGCTLNFDPTALRFVSAVGAEGTTMLLNDTQAAAGQLGLCLIRPYPHSFPRGETVAVTLVFTVPANARLETTGIFFSDLLAHCVVADTSAAKVPVICTSGRVTIKR